MRKAGNTAIWSDWSLAKGRGGSCLGEVARKVRIQYPGALYHVINRGNYRRDVFETVSAAQAFETVLEETCVRA